MSILLGVGSRGYHPMRVACTFLALPCLASAVAGSGSGGEGKAGHVAFLRELRLDLEDMQAHNLEMERLRKVPAQEVHSLTLEGQAEKDAEKSLLKAVHRSGASAYHATWNATNVTGGNQTACSSTACSWLQRLVDEILRHRALVFACTVALSLLLCGCLWRIGTKTAGDLERGSDDLDEVWFRKPERPHKRASSQ
ncbi:unnamed protein product [Effrenium voratum]|nr:unnamed protein product [Effrenium voratum]|mmetsp:Transcript_26585/g.63389  ORF Transcript_26585/g.63389 Transcript_26585/m.63389 type:complete len:196 (+) Transcript_26585:39-626(+)